jgi:exo-1,4-beta-D-glucosaminidase
MRATVLFLSSVLPLVASTRVDLRQGWSIQSSAKVAAQGDVVSTAAFNPAGWYSTGVPTTVLAALVDHKVYPDPYFGMNLRSIPGTTYPIGAVFSNLPMPEGSPFAAPWWYRTEFRIPATAKGKTLWLNFDAINYKADIWLNGRRIASAKEALGMYRMFEFDITDAVKPDAANTLALEVYPPAPNDLGLTWVDWNPMPPDKDMGLVRDVYILASGPASVRSVQVASKVDASLDQAHLTIRALVCNATERPIQGTLAASSGAIKVSRNVSIAAHGTSRVEFTPSEFPQLNVRNPKLWWPYLLGPQNLERLHVEFVSGGQVSDAQDVQFGIREVTSELDDQKHRLFKINGRNILIRGGGWSPDMLMRYDDEREENEIRYARDMHLNTIRLEGKMMNDHFFETCDRLGVLVMPGWCCCSHWERWQNWKPEDYEVAGESLRDQVRRIQNHPSVFVWLYGSDESPQEKAEAAYLKVLEEEHWPNPNVSSAAARTTKLTGPTGVKMTGPYEYVAPNYWLLDDKRGGGWGFNTETSPGPAIPVEESLAQMLPKEHMWPIDEFWNYHAGGGRFRNVNIFNAALEGRYGKAKNLEDYVKKSQVMAYEGERAMFEAYGRNKYKATGVVQWMLNNAWPSIIWHLYDYYLRPGGGYFGTKKANEPLHVQYSYDDRSVVVVNSYYQKFPHQTVTAKVFNMDMKQMAEVSGGADLGEDSATRVLTIPEIEGLSRAYFVRLLLQDEHRTPVSRNFYWLSTQPDVNDWAHSDGRYTPISTYADMKDLEKLPPAKVTVTSRTEIQGAEQVEHVTVENVSPNLAFFVRLRAMKSANGGEIAPAIWEDNYFELPAGELREVTASFARKLTGGQRIRILADGWNVAPAESR